MIDPMTAMRLARLDPLSADPAGMSVALHLPDGLGIREGSAQLTIEAQRSSDTGVASSYSLRERPNAIWRLNERDQSLLRQDLAEIRAWEAADPDGTSGSFSVSLEPCAIGAGPRPDATVSAELELAPGAGFLPLLNDVPIMEVLAQSGHTEIEPCASP